MIRCQWWVSSMLLTNDKFWAFSKEKEIFVWRFVFVLCAEKNDSSWWCNHHTRMTCSRYSCFRFEKFYSPPKLVGWLGRRLYLSMVICSITFTSSRQWNPKTLTLSCLPKNNGRLDEPWPTPPQMSFITNFVNYAGITCVSVEVPHGELWLNLGHTMVDGRPCSG